MSDPKKCWVAKYLGQTHIWVQTIKGLELNLDLKRVDPKKLRVQKNNGIKKISGSEKCWENLFVPQKNLDLKNLLSKK